jgi:hypothetical protein
MTQTAFSKSVWLESLRGRKKDRFVSVPPEQTLYAPQHPRVIINHYNEAPIWHEDIPDLSCRNNPWGPLKDRRQSIEDSQLT